jgi:release factor glutamine methyltransferase
MLLKAYRTFFIQELSTYYDQKEVESFFYLLLEKLHAMKRVDVVMKSDFSLTPLQIEKWNYFLVELKNYKPIQYLLEEAHFYGLTFFVSKDVLIPRPETEELVDWILEDAIEKEMAVLDIGTGSGCIAISIAKNLPKAYVGAIDVSEKALEVARKNAQNNEVTIAFELQNILLTEALSQTYDVIVSNPPYVRNLEKVEIQKNVLDNEPHVALFVSDDNPLLFYEKIAQLALTHLSKEGKLYFEINQYLGCEMILMLQSLGFKNCVLKKDIFGNDRMIRCEL